MGNLLIMVEKILILIETILKQKEPFIIGGIVIISVMSIIYISDPDKVVTVLTGAIGALAGMAGVAVGRAMARSTDGQSNEGIK